MVDDLGMYRTRLEPLLPTTFMRCKIATNGLAALDRFVIKDVGCIRGEKIRHLVPQTILRVLRVRALQLFYRAHRLGAIDIARQLVE